MRKILVFLAIILIQKYSYSQITGNFNVGGDIDKFYPVTFNDAGWYNNTPTNLILTRFSIHLDSEWRGSLMSEFKYHVTAWGHGSNYIDADIKSSRGSVANFIAGWADATQAGTCNCIIIWLRGGNTTYYYQSNYAVNPTVYDGVQNALPYNEVNGPAHSFKTSIDEYALTTGTYENKNAFFMANVGIGTISPDEKLTVKGKIHTQEVRVDMAGPLVPDYVFADDYKLKSLEEVENYIKEKKHLPEIPSAQEIEKNGLMLAEMNMALLKKIEEMTLYMIEMKKENEKQNEKIKLLENQLKK